MSNTKPFMNHEQTQKVNTEQTKLIADLTAELEAKDKEVERLKGEKLEKGTE